MNLKLLFGIIFVFLLAGKVEAKRYNPYGADWSIGFHFGGTSFFGDIKGTSGSLSNTPFSKYFYQDMRLMGGFNMEKWFGPFIGITGAAQYGTVKGTKETSNAWFEANFFEYNLSVIVNLSNLILDIDRRRHWMIYTGFGIGMSESRTWKYSISDNNIIGTNGFGIPRKSGGKYIPMTESMGLWSLGGKFFIGSNLSLNFEGSMHIINSDKLDATTNDNSSFIAGIEGYNYFTVGLQYWFGWNGYHITNRYKHRARYNGGRTGYVKINPRKRSRSRHKLFKRKKRNYKIRRRR